MTPVEMDDRGDTTPTTPASHPSIARFRGTPQ